MKIIEHGVVPPVNPPWPIGETFECHRCHCQFVIEDGDKFRQETERSFNGKTEIWIGCPDCAVLLNFFKLNITRKVEGTMSEALARAIG